MRNNLIHMLHKIKAGYTPTYLVVVVELPTGAREIITNVSSFNEKIEYYLNSYDENMCLKANNLVKIVDLMVG